MDTTDFHVEAIDLLNNRVPCEAGIALVVAVYSAIKRHSVLPGLVILGDLSIQGNIKSVRSLAEPLQVAMDNGARRALIPLENKRNFLDVSGRHRGAGRSGVLLRPDDGGDEGAGDDVIGHRQRSRTETRSPDEDASVGLTASDRLLARSDGRHRLDAAGSGFYSVLSRIDPRPRSRGGEFLAVFCGPGHGHRRKCPEAAVRSRACLANNGGC